MKIDLSRAKAYIKHLFQANSNGHGVHSPFAYKLCEEVFYNKHFFYDFEELRAIRLRALNDQTLLDVEDHGAGSNHHREKKRAVRDIARTSTSSQQKSELLYKLANYLNPSCVLELGTNLGLTTLYLAKASPRVITIEGSNALFSYSDDLFKNQKQSNIIAHHALFDDILPTVLEQEKPEFIFVDGNHRKEATIRYFEWILKTAKDQTVVVFDDIHWSRGMDEAWQEIKSNPRVTLSIDFFYFGIVFFRKEIKEKVHLKLRL
jgi:predicted O-methyltransferase YrrM